MGDRIRWLIRRGRTMGAAELLGHGLRWARQRRDRGGRLARAGLPDTLLASPPPALPLDPRGLASLDTAESRSLEVDVDALLRGSFTVLGVERSAAERTDWSWDPVHRSRWPTDVYCHDLDFRSADRDVKVVWELGRLQHLQLLALAARCLDRADARDAAVADLRSWIDDNPPFSGVGWASGLELASRVVSVLVVSAALGPESLDRATRAAVWRSLDAHGRWIARYPALDSSANNHLVAEMAALAILGHLAPDLPQAGRWRRTGLARLRRAVERQILADGVGAEQSPAYQAYTLEWYLLVRRVCGPFDPATEARLALGARFLTALLGEDDEVPQIGDGDDAVVLRTGLAPGRYPLSVAGVAAAVLGEPGPPAWRPDLRAIWLGGGAAGGAAVAGSSSFPVGGYTLLRDRRWTALIDHGPLGFAPVAGHGHADALSVWARLQGAPLLVDSGTYRYNADPTARRWFRGTAAHNTVQIDGLDQAQQHGTFLWGRPPAARATAVDLEGRSVTAEHDGYLALRGVLHSRTVRLLDGVLLVEDELAGTGDVDVRVHWHLASDVEVDGGPGAWRLRVAGLTCRVAQDGAPIEEVLRDGTGYGPWSRSPAYGVLDSAPTLRWSGRLALPARVVTRFEPEALDGA